MPVLEPGTGVSSAQGLRLENGAPSGTLREAKANAHTECGRPRHLDPVGSLFARFQGVLAPSCVLPLLQMIRPCKMNDLF